tara:strand:- start:9522 stop:10115 length:594 start_codon:yes stop_codon:yes gene_type:complete
MAWREAFFLRTQKKFYKNAIFLRRRRKTCSGPRIDKASVNHREWENSDMPSGSENNALVEIALALSMAFFSLMVLTMVSMSTGTVGKIKKTADVLLDISGVSIKRASSTKSQDGKSGSVTAIQPEKMAVFYKGQLYDAGLNPLASHQLQSEKIQFLAVAPELPLRQAISVRDRFGNANLIVTTLNDAWLMTLKEKIK